jgi:FkbM family methyltransferase
MTFEQILKEKLIQESRNYYKDNYDYYAFPKKRFTKKVINIFKWLFFRPVWFKISFKSKFIFRKFLGIFHIRAYIQDLEQMHQTLADSESKDLFIKIVCFRVLGYVKVKLPLSSPSYWGGIKQIESCVIPNQELTLPHKPYKLPKHEFKDRLDGLAIYLGSKAIFTTFIIEQYRYSNKIDICATSGDIVLDFGGCYGDTALYFASKIGGSGKVFTFEFIPSNIDIMKINLQLNPELESRVEIVNRPLWDTSNNKVFYSDRGASSQIDFREFDNYDGTTSTITCDDFVEIYKLEQVNFIKTDIEGAEPYALRGAQKTIRRFKPKLAISIYHNMSDFTKIIKQIDELNLGYKFYLGHATFYASETVLFCNPE